MTLKISVEKPPLKWLAFTNEQWAGYADDDFRPLIKRWCNRHGFVQYVEPGYSVPARSPYRRGNTGEGEDYGKVYAAEDFMAMVEKQRRDIAAGLNSPPSRV